MKNSFSIKYSVIVWALLCLVFVLSLSGLIWNIFNLIYFLNAGVIKILTYAMLIVATATLFGLVLSVILFGKYTVKNGVLCMHMGIFKNKINIDEIAEITLFKKSNKLVVYSLDSKFIIVLISPNDYDSFVMAMREQNPKIIYSTRIDGEDTPL